MRRNLRRALGLLIAACLLAVAATPVLAAPKTGCSAERSGWGLKSVGDATAYIWPRLLDPSAFGSEAGLMAVIESYDRNGDGNLCFRVMWGEDLNPKSHYYRLGLEVLGAPTEQMFVRDNTANAK